MSDPLRILMIEDSAMDADLVVRQLRKSSFNFAFKRVDSLKAFEKELLDYHPQVILSDYNIPAFDPMEALATAKRLCPNTPFIFVSGTIGEELAIETLKSGATDYVLKDNLVRLEPAIKRALEENKQRAEKKRAEETLRLLQKAVGNMQLGVTITDLIGRILFTNPAEAEMHGYKVEEVIGKDARIFAPRELWRSLSEDQLRDMKSWKRESINVRQDGNIFPVQIISDVVTDSEGNPLGIVNITEDITDLHAAQHAFYDNLTRLPTRALFLDRVGRAVKRIKRKADFSFAVFYVDLDHFKAVNDQYGYQVGDLLLVACARRMEACLRFGDSVARLGSDEFGVLLEDLKGPEDAIFVAERVQRQTSTPFNLNGREVQVRASIGVVFGTSAYDRADEVLRDANTSLYRAKALGRNRHEVFDRTMQTRAGALLPLEAGLKRAIEQNELTLHYQPIVSLESGKIHSFEALLRWQNPHRGLLHPADFIPIAEDTSLIGPIGEWVIRKACVQNKAWQDAGFPRIGVAVNLSARQLDQRDLVATIARILTETRLAPEFLELELTENILLENAEKTLRTLAELKALGVRLSIDDFGTGYSSLGYLKRFYIDSLKIDQSFVQELTTDPKDEAIARAVITLAHSLKLRVIAEGVETEEQLAFLKWHECDEIQGFLFSPPLPPEQFEVLLKEGRTLTEFAEKSKVD